MVVLGLKLDNILSFDDFSIDFSYKSKLKTNIIDGEFLKDVPSFKYKKFAAFIGSNASGKTSLIKSIWKTLFFLREREKNIILDLVNDEKKDSYIVIDMVLRKSNINELHRFKILIKSQNKDVLISHLSQKINSSISSKDNYTKMISVFDSKEDNYVNYLECLNEFEAAYGWNMVLPATEADFDVIRFINTDNLKDEKDYLKIMKTVFSSLDPSVKDVIRSRDSKDAYVIVHENGRRPIIQEGMKLSSILCLSSGTKYGVNISNLIYSIKHHLNGIYLIDEQFSYINSDLELAFLSTMVSMLGDGEQLFFTTHNHNVLSMKYPFHSFYFLKKELINDKQKIIVSCASEAENRNNVIPKSLVDNDVFSIMPDVSKIYELGD